MNTSTRLRQLADRMGLDGFAEELREIAGELDAKAAPAEPFGYFRAEPFGWTDCAATDEGAIALYERPAAPAVPQGWKLVPVEPTPEMKAAGITIEVYSEVSDCIGALTWPEVDAIYRAMLAATPAAPSQEAKCAQCHKPYRKGAGTKGCPKCAPGVDVPESEFHKPISAPSQPVTLTDEYAGVIAWVGDKQCKRVLTEGAIKHEHTPGVAMRNTAHQCVQEVIIAALREKERK